MSFLFTGSIYISSRGPYTENDHIIRMIIGPENKRLMICSILAGAALLIIADLACRTLIAPAIALAQ